MTSPNNKLVTHADLQGIWNLSKEELDKLAEITTFLPTYNYVNVNTLEEMYFRSLFPEGSVGAQLRQSSSKKYASINEFFENIGTKKIPEGVNLTMLSSYFLLQLRVKSGTMELKANALLQRSNNETKIRSLWWH